MKTITIRLPDVEAAMLAELQARRGDLRNLSIYLSEAIRKEYATVAR
ncbi:MAG: hypothetical protein VKK05_09650 [Synechococcus sp.]|nr:hypothetical protein [Synechococcus sp.]